MVPKKVGSGLRRRRMLLGLRQADLARAMGTTRAYVSAVERGVEWDPDADKLVVWAEELGWPADKILRDLGRPVMATTEPAILTAELVEAIKLAVAEGVRDGVLEAMQPPAGQRPKRRGERRA